METYESKLVKNLVEKMDTASNLMELCEIYHSAVKEITTVYEQHVGRIIRENENEE